MRIKRTASEITLIIIMLCVTLVSSNINWGSERWKGIIEVDAKGYYAYLPAIFIYHDLNFGFFDKIEKEKYFDQNLYYDYRAYADGKTITKYYAGTAVAEMPFFLIAHALSSLMHYDSDGYSRLYPIFINIAALFYLFIGLLFLNRTFSGFGVKEWIKSLVLFAAVFGTNLFYYTVGEPGMSHIYSFAFIAAFFYYSRLHFTSFNRSYIIVVAMVLGMIVLIRPVNGLILFIWPFAAGDFSTLKRGFSNLVSHKLHLAGGILIFIAVCTIQLVIYKISTGKFFVYSYTGEGFDFMNPHFVETLFSYKKGLFLYTPLYLLSFIGLFYFWRNSRFSVFSWLGFFILLTYILSSWSNWYYGGSFSSRVFVEYIPLFMILLAMGLQHTAGKIPRILYVISIVLLTLLCQIQTYQYRYNQIHWSEMNKEKYWDVFLRIDKL